MGPSGSFWVVLLGAVGVSGSFWVIEGHFGLWVVGQVNAQFYKTHTKFKTSNGTLPLNINQTAILRGEGLDLMPIQMESDCCFSRIRKEVRRCMSASLVLKIDQLSEYDGDSSETIL